MEVQQYISPEEWNTCLSVLEKIKDNTSLTPDLSTFQKKTSQVLKKIRNEQKGKSKNKRDSIKQIRKLQDRALIESTALAQAEPFDELVPNQRVLSYTLPEGVNSLKLHQPKKCYVCCKQYHEVHHFYVNHCPDCAEHDYEKRFTRADLTGQRALVTGGRIKIGYEIVLKLLRDGAEVIVTTRFPEDALSRYKKEKDFPIWKDRLTLYYLDLKHIPAVEAFTRHLCETLPSLEIIINNAAQTIRRPANFYQHLETTKQISLPSEDKALIAQWASHYEKQDKLLSYNTVMGTSHKDFPVNKLDKDGQQIDLRKKNSSNTKLENVDIIEMLEVQMINVTAPFIINSRLKSLLKRSPFKKRFIINVSAMEGQFNRKSKTPYHPHTNMGKAALNMMTRTSASDYAEDNIFMNSVDTGWVTQEQPYHIKKGLRERGFVPPLDSIDGASRVYDTIVEGVKSEKPQYGHFMKDYKMSSW